MNSFSVIIPALNEEANIDSAVRSVIKAVSGLVADYEIIVVDDGSSDETGNIAARLAHELPNLTVVHNGVNMGVGHSLLRGFRVASKQFVTCFPGDNDMAWQSLRNILAAGGNTDLVISYIADNRHRSLVRRLLSSSFVGLLNVVFALRLKYYNGPFVFPRDKLVGLNIKSDGLGIISECIVKLIKVEGCSYTQVPFEHIGRKAGKSTALSRKSIASVMRSLRLLVVDVYMKPRRTHGSDADRASRSTRSP